MNDVEQIIEKIKRESEERVREIRAKGEKEVEEYLKQAKERIEAQKKEILDDAEKRVNAMSEYDEGAVEKMRKGSISNAKTTLLVQWMNKARRQAEEMWKDGYFSLLSDLIFDYCEAKEGEIIFSKKDKKRLPKDFMMNVNMRISLKGAFLRLSKSTADIDGGFILRYGRVEQNCSFEAIFDDKWEEFQDAVMSILNEVDE